MDIERKLEMNMVIRGFPLDGRAHEANSRMIEAKCMIDRLKVVCLELY